MGRGRGFTFILGSLFGIYVAQHYRVPRIGDWAHSSCVKARELEQAYRRPENLNPNERHRAHELDQAYRRPDYFNPNEGHRAHDCWFRAKYHERNFRRPENFYGNEAGEEQNNEVVHPSLSRPMDLNRPKTLDTNEEQNNNKVLDQDWARPMDPNEVRDKPNKNNAVHPSWVRPRDLNNKPYKNNGPENFNPNEGDQE
ncbi:hypothetical protein KY290_002161 [Solanum tuberosum]|uniref:Uncharacterized protein n=1 Tax=Solanum tuberosum TaxID=4113 RepID=A0ABQ7WR73_SOLTU|nr:hypothetical protein KY284_002206 [Solanum tuberosum]KAH0766179.1 hypothetical protein KY285_002050 [Solanum tuberosum]KAH0782563.1 hypothetical protein KY290_002161 [Solanum tuberosum]